MKSIDINFIPLIDGATMFWLIFGLLELAIFNTKLLNSPTIIVDASSSFLFWPSISFCLTYFDTIVRCMHIKNCILFWSLNLFIHPMQKSKMAVWGGLTNSCEKKRSEKQRRKERYTRLNAGFQRIARRDKKAFLKGSMQRNRGKQQNGKD